MNSIPLSDCRTVGITINRPADQVYAYMANPESFAEWSDFITGLERDDAGWIAQTPVGAMRIAFTPLNAFRVLDHDVTNLEGTLVHVPMRVLPHGAKSEVIFSVLRQPAVTAEQFDADVALVVADLANLKQVLEEKPS